MLRWTRTPNPYEREDEGVEEHLDPYFNHKIFRVDYRRALDEGAIAPFKIAMIEVNMTADARAAYDEHDFIRADTDAN
ncbi:MAG TPA: hypothetical protein VM328_00390 [Fimbriimonadaceae bacterium]|nr:hypothetical protein [Fimbriimonadaceae bacterium]